MNAICYVKSVGGRVRSHEVKVEISSDGQLPDYFMVPGEVIDNMRFDPRTNWDSWVSGGAGPGVQHTRCERFYGVTYIDKSVLDKFIRDNVSWSSPLPPPGAKIVSENIFMAIEKRRKASEAINVVYNYNYPMEWMELTSDQD
jgi:hypothetical protein